MEFPVGSLYFFGDFTVDSGHAVKGEEFAVEFLYEFFNRVRIAADDAFMECVDDQVVDFLVVCERGADDLCGAVNNAECPVDGGVAGDFPCFPSGFEFAG